MMPTIVQTYDVVVCGGGLAGLCAAVAAARHGARVCLVHDRPVLGGNASSEVGVTVHGSAQYHSYARETGIISEILIEDRARNHEEINENGWTNSVFDMVLYDLVERTPNLTVHLNTSVTSVQLAGGAAETEDAGIALGFYHRRACNRSRRIEAVTARVANAETELTLRASMFLDCTGDALVADLAGCEWRMGTESRGEFDEPHAPEASSTDTMGSSIHIRARDMGRAVPYAAPPWAVRHENADFFYKQGRVPYDPTGGFWWLEIGVPWHTIHDNESIRHELTRHALGVWDWMKNRDPRLKKMGVDNYALDWIGQVPGKRESRRVIGRYFMTEHDVLNKVAHPDEIAYGGWFVDLHTPGGLLADSSEPSNVDHKLDSEYAAKSYCGPYGIPLRILIARDLDNLGMAGRNVSVTHAALGTVRVMATTALLGQALGTAAALGIRKGIDLPGTVEHVGEIQQLLLCDGCFLPNVRNVDLRDLARAAEVSVSSEARLHEVAPDATLVDGGIGRWGLRGEGEALKNRRGQFIAVADRIDSLAVCVSNDCGETQTVEAVLLPVEHIWDYRVEMPPLAKATLAVPPGQRQWVTWPVGIPAGRTGYVRLDLLANAHIRWHESRRVEPGCTAVFAMSATKMRSFYDSQSLSFRIAPPQPVFGASNVISGVTRPHRSTNLWRADPGHAGPHAVELRWAAAVALRQVHLTFPGHLLREYHAYPPFYVDPQCSRDYSLAVPDGASWRDILAVTGNYHRHRVHDLPEPVRTDRLRLTIHATNGDVAPGVYEIRCYA